MKVLDITNTIRHGTVSVDLAISLLQKRIEQLMRHFAYVLPHGWRLIIEIDHPGYPDEYCRFDLQDDQGGGSFAAAKMETLKRYPDLMSSGMLTVPMVQTAIVDSAIKGLPDEEIRYVNDTLVAADSFDRKMHEWVRDHIGISVFDGAFRVPIRCKPTVLDSDDDGHMPIGEYRVSFSGAAEWQDVGIALMVTDLIAEELDYDFSQLNQLYDTTSIRFLIDLIYKLDDRPETNPPE